MAGVRRLGKCEVVGCDRNAIARNFCSMHWQRARNDKNPSAPSRFEMTDAQRFWAKVDVRGEDECWLWRGGKKGRDGVQYGSAWFGGKNDLAHRVAWILTNGEIPEVPGADHRGTCLLHSCDNPLCVNPLHLTPGTHLQNMQDKVAKGRDVSRKPFCKRGHPRTPENLYTSKQGLRACRECHKLRERERQRRLRGNREQRTSSF